MMEDNFSAATRKRRSGQKTSTKFTYTKPLNNLTETPFFNLEQSAEFLPLFAAIVYPRSVREMNAGFFAT